MGYHRKQNTMVLATQRRIKKLIKDTGCPDCHDCKDNTTRLGAYENIFWNFDRLFEGRSNVNCPCIGCKKTGPCKNIKGRKYQSKHNSCKSCDRKSNQKYWGCSKPKNKCKKCPNCVYCPPRKYSAFQ